MEMKFVWVFQGNGAEMISAAFSSKEKAEKWISNTKVEGILFQFPLDKSAYDYSVENGSLKITKEFQKDKRFIQKFPAGYLPHEHYEEEREGSE